MIPENVLNPEDLRGMMLDRMEKHLSLKTEGYRSLMGETDEPAAESGGGRQQHRDGVPTVVEW